MLTKFSYMKFKTVIPILALLILGPLAYVYFYQESFFMFPQKTAQDFQYNSKYPVVESFLNVDGDKIHILRVGSEDPKNAQVLYFHGNGENNEWTIGFAEKMISNLNVTVWLMDYPGYGKSSGHIRSQKQLENVVDAFVENVKSKSTGGIYGFGFSMGTYFANYAASKHSLKALILTAPYINAKEQISDFAKYFPLWLLRYDLDNSAVLPTQKNPVLLIHGDQDNQVNVRHSRFLKDIHKDSKLVIIEGARHNDLTKYPQYWETVKSFLSFR